MTTNFFSTSERIAALKVAALPWLGTPFVPNAAVKGAGVSCQKLVGGILIEAGALPLSFELPNEPMEWGQAHSDSLVEQFMAAHADRFALIDGPAFVVAQPGDVLGIRFGGCVHHCGLVLAEHGAFIHCIRGEGVILGEIRDAVFMRMIKKVWRPLRVATGPET